MSLVEKLVTLRKQKGMTQMDLAEQLNVSRQAISRWEVGAAVPSTDNLRVLGDLYGVQIDYLLNDDNVHEPKSTETPEETQDNRDDVKKHGKYRILLACVLIVMFAFSVIGIVNNQKQEREQFVPIEDMTVEDGDGYSEVTFPFE